MAFRIKIRQALTENIPLKIAALIIAVILWLFVTSKGQTEVSLDVPIDFVNIPQGLDIVKYDLKSVNIVLRGYERFLKNIKQGDVRVSIDLGRAKKGETTLSIRQEDIRIPYSVSVIRIEPSSIKVTLEEKTVKKIPIRPVITGRPERGYYVASVETRPDEIKIEGVISEVRKTNYINTEPVDITGLREDLYQDVGLDLAGKKIKPETDRIEIKIRIKRRGR
jgi:YbbR domain-containing protein